MRRPPSLPRASGATSTLRRQNMRPPTKTVSPKTSGRSARAHVPAATRRALLMGGLPGESDTPRYYVLSSGADPVKTPPTGCAAGTVKYTLNARPLEYNRSGCHCFFSPTKPAKSMGRARTVRQTVSTGWLIKARASASPPFIASRPRHGKSGRARSIQAEGLNPPRRPLFPLEFRFFAANWWAPP